MQKDQKQNKNYGDNMERKNKKNIKEGKLKKMAGGSLERGKPAAASKDLLAALDLKKLEK